MNEIPLKAEGRDPTSSRMRDEFLKTGKVPLGDAISKGMTSLVRDPWLMLITYMPGPLGFKLRQLYYHKTLGHMGKGVLFDPAASITTPGNVYIDDFTYIGRLAQIYSPEGYVRIGKRCHVSAWILGHAGVEIGNYVAASGNIISITDSHKGGYRMSGPMVPPEQRNLRRGKIVIEDDAFLGLYCMVMPGVHIGEGAVIGPYSLVIEDVPAWTVVMGTPAREISTRKKVRFSSPD